MAITPQHQKGEPTEADLEEVKEMDLHEKVLAELREIVGDSGDNKGRDGLYTSDRLAQVIVQLRGSYIIGHAKGKQVQEILNRYVGEELEAQLNVSDEDEWSNPEEVEEMRARVQKDIDYITGLAKLFD